MVDNTNCKLILLYVLDKIEIPLERDLLLSICYYDNKWLMYHEATEAITQLEAVGFIHCDFSNKQYFYSITPKGRQCLASFYTRIHNSIRESISKYAKENRLNLRKKQELFRDYFQNQDGTYTISLKIFESKRGKALDKALLDLKMVVDDKDQARYVYENWEDKAAKIYELLLDNLVE